MRQNTRKNDRKQIYGNISIRKQQNLHKIQT